MKKRVLQIILISILFVIILGIKTSVNANSISSIDMDIYVDKNGNANVTEIWNCNSTSKTEWYRSYFNLGNSNITNLRVFDKTKNYTTLNSWNVDASFNQKAYKCGINKKNNGIEICWGKSQYGLNVYTLKYNISNFVSELTDSQMMYWTLIPREHFEKMGAIKIKIHAYKSFESTIPVWGYGKYGALCYVDKNDGAIYMDTEGKSLAKSEYMTFLAKFPKETFNTSNVLNHDFNYYYEMAQEGSIAYNGKKKYNSLFEVIVTGILSFAYVIIIIIPFARFAIKVFKDSARKYGFKYGKAKKRIPKKVPYYREIPCDGDIFRTYYIAYQYGIMKNKTDILGAIILKWLKQGIIRTEQRGGGNIFKKEETLIILKNDSIENNYDTKEIFKTKYASIFDNKKESELFYMMYEASKDGVLENKEFEIWCRKSYEKILDWFDEILREQRVSLISDGLIKVDNKSIWGKQHIATYELKDEALKIAGLKRFLLEYTLIKERNAIEVELFENYLIYAQLLGIAKQVSKQFKKVYPDIIEQTNYGSYDNLIYINYVSSSGVSNANSARDNAESYSYGGGGFSSGGGGGGSFGGGGGIGSR